jgi:4-carboxymuconolactone decarboxylase
MALIPYPDENKLSEESRNLLHRGRVVLNVARMVANSEASLYPFSKFGNSLMTRAKLDAKLRELAILRTAKVSGSVYEWTQHVPIARGCGVTDEQIAAMDNPGQAACFSPLERLVLDFTDQVARNVKGKPETVAELKKHLGPAEIVELILSIGWWGLVARLLETTEVDLEEFAGKMNLLEDFKAASR